MPGVADRACSSSTKLFQAATKGRGSAVMRIVSSTSEMTPSFASGSTTATGASAGSLSPACRVRVCQPGVSATGTIASITPPRSAVISVTNTPSIETRTCW
jgi:hypothetical protein